MTDADWLFIEEFNKAVQTCSAFAYITRASDLQEAPCKKLEEELVGIAVEKAAAIANGAEDYANILLGCESVATALKAELRMYLLLKQGRPDEAWNELVDAQAAVADAIRADPEFGHVGTQLDRLGVIEAVMFPPQRFFSSGMIVESQICSICGEEYD